jgi:predicted ATP-dependent serine protease
LADTPNAPDWIWTGYLAPGVVTLLAGRPKAGKSTLFFGLLEALATGEALLDIPVRQCGALLLSEERQQTLNDKLQRFPAANRNTHLLMRYQARGVSWPTIVELSVEHCKEHDLGLLAVDTSDKWFGLGDDSENTTGKVLDAVAPLMWAAAQGLSVVIVAHQRKAPGQHGDAIRGSNSLAGAVDVIIEVERLRGGDRAMRVLRSSSRFSGTPEEVVFRLAGGGYEACGTVGDYSDHELDDRVLGAVTAAGVTVDMIADHCELSKTKAYKTLTRLADQGHIGREGAGTRGSPFLFISKHSSRNETKALRLLGGPPPTEPTNRPDQRDS